MKQMIALPKLVVNPENYRFDPLETEDQAIEFMLNQKKQEILNLAKDIAENGLDQAKAFRVIEKDGKFLVLDGNRRSTALKCLANPATISDKKLCKDFEKVSKNAKHKVSAIDAFVYTTEEQAARWIKLDHTGKNSGVGQDPWDSLSIDRFSFKFEGKKSPALQVIDFVQEQRGVKFDPKKVKISTISRILSNPEARARLGIDIKNQQVQIIADEKEVSERLFTLITKIISDDVNVAAVYNKEDIISFSNELFSDVPAPKGQVSLLDEASSDGLAKIPRRSPITKKTLPDIFGGVKLRLNKGTLNNIYFDILRVYEFYLQDQNKLKKQQELSEEFPSVIRAMLRLLIEEASSGTDRKSFNNYVTTNYSPAKSKLSDDQKTTLSHNSIKCENDLIKLVWAAGHTYSSCKNIEQTLALSIIIAKMIEITHGKK